MSRKILITGGAGFLGIHLFEYLRASGNEVYLLDQGDRMARLQHYGCDNKLIICKLGTDKISKLPELDIIVHLAALPHVDYSYYYPKKTLNNNINSFIDILEYAVRKKIYVVLASSVEVYSSVTDGVCFNESMTTRPVSPYGVSKSTCEMIAKNYRQCYGLKYNIFRLTNLYGEYQLPDRIIPRTICRILAGMDIEIDSGYFRDFLYVKDACVGIEKIMNFSEYGEIFNLSSGLLLSMEEIGEKIVDVMGTGTLHINEQDLAGKQRYHMLKIDNRKAMESIDWKPYNDIQQGITKVVEWYRISADWYNQFYDSYTSSRKSKRFIIDSNY